LAWLQGKRALPNVRTSTASEETIKIGPAQVKPMVATLERRILDNLNGIAASKRPEIPFQPRADTLNLKQTALDAVHTRFADNGVAPHPLLVHLSINPGILTFWGTQSVGSDAALTITGSPQLQVGQVIPLRNSESNNKTPLMTFPAPTARTNTVNAPPEGQPPVLKRAYKPRAASSSNAQLSEGKVMTRSMAKQQQVLPRSAKRPRLGDSTQQPRSTILQDANCHLVISEDEPKDPPNHKPSSLC
jgi:hypothetical protein